MPEPNIVRMVQIGNLVWVNYNDLTAYLGHLPTDALDLDTPDEYKVLFRQWTDMLLDILGNSTPAWIKTGELADLEKEEL